MSTHNIGDWVAIITDEGKVCTGQISLIEISREATKYTVDILADDQYRHLAPRWEPIKETPNEQHCIDEIANLL